MPLPIGLIYDAAGHVILDPDTAIQGALRHLLTTFEAAGSATAVVKAFRAAGLTFPWRHRKGPRKGETDWQPLRHSTVLHVLHNPRYAGAFTYGRHREQPRPGRKRGSSITVPRQEWISFIPGAHPGYITLDQWEANIARLAANAAAHGRDRAAGPPREGPALLQGIIICGRCGGRMTIRYHAHGGKDLPTYLCQRDGIDNARPICAAIPGHTLDEHVGQLLIDTLTPLAVEAALQVSAELRQRAAEADALRATHVERARYHADLARRRYLTVDPANRLVADTLEADWNTALRTLNDAQTAYDKAREQHHGQLTEAQKARIAQLVTDLPGIWNDPATPARERKRIARLLLTDVTVTRTSDTLTAHARLAGGQARALTLPVPEPAWKIRQAKPATIAEIDKLLDHHTTAEIAAILQSRGLANGEERPYSLTMVHRVIRTYHLRSRAPATARRRADPAPPDSRTARRVPRHHQDLVPRRNCQRPAVQRQRPSPLPPARPQPTSPPQGRNHERRIATVRPRNDLNPPEMSDPTATVSPSTTTEHSASLRRGAVCNPRFRARRPRRGLDHPHALAGEDRVEGTGELGVAVPDQEAEGSDPVAEVHEQIAGLLSGPCAVRMGSHAEDVHVPGPHLHDEQHVQALEEDCVDMKEIAGQ